VVPLHQIGPLIGTAPILFLFLFFYKKNHFPAFSLTHLHPPPLKNRTSATRRKRIGATS
jgi:hypothetical protein